MAAKHSDDLKREAVRIATSNGLTRRQVTSDLGVAFSTFGKWMRDFADDPSGATQDAELARENERLRKENRILREEREVLKMAAIFFAGQEQRDFNSLRTTVEICRAPICAA
ncbi:transposase [Leisingera methylohalidivorans DSM 14336]|uniref:Transposase n=1 Tax=Leisingera methylohalidivorans DSM 14336 TaxID=999552 RepID=V9VZ41_9RHOB|nr:transposase [Leisingera methylohalidivorans DSM 14336]